MPTDGTPKKRAAVKKNVIKMPASTPRAEDVARRAYEIFEARGGEPGHDLDDWLQAEWDLRVHPVRRSGSR